MVVSTLRAYNFYLEKVSIEESKVEDKNIALIENAKFWTFHKHKEASVKAAWFELMATILNKTSKFLSNHHEQVTLTAFKFMDETDALICSYIWTSIVLVQAVIPSWNNYVNLEKAVYPKLWKTLKTGGGGNAIAIFPNLLPFVAKLDSDLLGDEHIKFYQTFFASINEGLRAVQGSRGDVNAVATAYYETLKYVTIQLTKSETVNDEVCLKFVDDHLVAVIYWVVHNETNIGKHVYSHIAGLLLYWQQNKSLVQLYEKLLVRFWSELFMVLKSSLDTSNGIEKFTASHMDLISSLKNASKVKGTVKFVEEADVVDGVKSDASLNINLTQLVYKLCGLYIEKAVEYKNATFIEHLETLMKDFQSLELFKHLAGSDEVIKLYETFSNWLNDKQLRTESAVELILSLVKFVSADQRVQILESIAKISNSAVQNWVLLRLLSHPLCLEPCVVHILSLPQVQSHLVDCAKAVTVGASSEHLNLLHKCFFQTETGDILINAETCEQIVDTISNALTNVEAKSQIDTCASFIAQIMPVICGDEAKRDLQTRTFIKLFQFSVQNVVTDDLSEDTLWEVTTAWQDALSSEDISLENTLTEKCAAVINDRLQNELSVESFERLAELSAKLITCSTENCHEEQQRLQWVSDICIALFGSQSNYEDEKNYLTKFCFFVGGLNGYSLTKELDSNTVFVDVELDEFLKNFTKTSLLKTFVLYKLSCSRKKLKHSSISEKNDNESTDGDYDTETVEDEEELTEDFVNVDEGLIKVWNDGLYKQALDVIYASAIADTIVINPVSHALQDDLILLSEKVGLLVRNVPDAIQVELKEKLHQLVLNGSGFWINCLPILKNFSQFNEIEQAMVVIFEDFIQTFNREEHLLTYVGLLQVRIIFKIRLSTLIRSKSKIFCYQRTKIPRRPRPFLKYQGAETS